MSESAPVLHNGTYVLDDLDQLPHGDLLDAFLDQVSESDEASWVLTRWPGSHPSPYFDVKGIEVFQQKGYNVYRIRPLFGKLKNYRILYAYDGRVDKIYLLAAVKRLINKQPGAKINEEFYDYEPNHPVTIRVREEYDQLNLPKIR